jgi:DNA polymerase III epsilon subunit-like protein
MAPEGDTAIRMTATTDFISELVRAANEAHKLEYSEARRLLERSVVTIRDMREHIGIPASNTSHDAVFDLQTVAASIERHDTGKTSRALLDAADMIRTLHIVLDQAHRYRPNLLRAEPKGLPYRRRVHIDKNQKPRDHLRANSAFYQVCLLYQSSMSWRTRSRCNP